VVVLGFFGDGIEAAKWLWHNPAYAVGGVGVYVLAGSGWGVTRWWVEVRKLARNCKELYITRRKEFLRSNKDELGGVLVTDATVVPPQLKKKWQEQPVRQGFWRLQVSEDGHITPPQASEYKATILTWMAFWPMSLLWTILDDFVKELYENIYQYLATWLQNISDKAFADLLVTQETDRAPKEDPENVGVTGLVGNTGTPEDITT
jgi:hypothetical protein